MTPQHLNAIADRLAAGIVSTEDAAAIRLCAQQWKRVDDALDEIAADAMEQAQLAEQAAMDGRVVRIGRR